MSRFKRADLSMKVLSTTKTARQLASPSHAVKRTTVEKKDGLDRFIKDCKNSNSNTGAQHSTYTWFCE